MTRATFPMIAAVALSWPGAAAHAQQTPMQVFRGTADTPAQAQRDQALQEELAYSAGVQAYIFGTPLVHLDGWRAVNITRNPQLRVNTFLQMPMLKPGMAPGGAGQVDTLYSPALLALENRPTLLTIPAGIERYFSVQITDAYANNIAYFNRGNAGGGGRYLIVGPAYSGAVPADAQLIRLPTNEGVVLVRVYAADRKDEDAAARIQKSISLAPADAAQEQPLASEQLAPTKAAGPLAFFERMFALIDRNPPAERMEPVVRAFAAAGLPVGTKLDLSQFTNAQRAGLTRAAAIGPEIVAWRIRNRGERVRGWNIDLTGGNFGDDNLLRAAGVAFGLVVNPPEESLYFRAYNDADGAALDSAKEYQIVFDKGQLPACRAFWSVTSYDSNFDLVANAREHYAVNVRDPELKFQADGSLVIDVTRRPPAGSLANWLPAPAEGPFAMTLRCYEPEAEMLDRARLRQSLPTIRRAIR